MHARSSAFTGIVHQLCPRCRLGKIFRSSIFLFPKMHERCPVCALKFEREQGYFLGAMYISYGMALAIIVLFTILVWAVTRAPIVRDVIWAIILFLPFAPSVTLLARILWIYFDQAVDPDRPS
jgi:uncharacterized protein (DUF983 family)